MTDVELKRQTYLIDRISYVIDSLKDTQQYDAGDGAAALGINDATWSLFGVVWPASRVLASTVCQMELDGKRVLEIGCGIALTSIVLHQMGQDITASDYHPLAEEFLNINILNNSICAGTVN